MDPVSNFELNKYLGKWYEIARLPSWFEKDMTNVTATYSLAKNGKVKVENAGYVKEKQKRAIVNCKGPLLRKVPESEETNREKNGNNVRL